LKFDKPSVSGRWPKGSARVAAGELYDSRMTDEAPDPAMHYGGLIGVYQEAIRLCDFKANLTVLFVAIMMGPVVASRDKFPHFLSLPLALAPFLVAFFCLLMVVFPRFPRRETRNFLIVRNPTKSDFQYSEHGDDDIEQLKLRCAILSGILFWKNTFLKIALCICLATLLAAFFLLTFSLV
jgi:hypothetical protein